jgi:hypothetical protein
MLLVYEMFPPAFMSHVWEYSKCHIMKDYMFIISIKFSGCIGRQFKFCHLFYANLHLHHYISFSDTAQFTHVGIKNVRYPHFCGIMRIHKEQQLAIYNAIFFVNVHCVTVNECLIGTYVLQACPTDNSYAFCVHVHVRVCACMCVCLGRGTKCQKPVWGLKEYLRAIITTAVYKTDNKMWAVQFVYISPHDSICRDHHHMNFEYISVIIELSTKMDPLEDVPLQMWLQTYFHYERHPYISVGTWLSRYLTSRLTVLAYRIGHSGDQSSLH